MTMFIINVEDNSVNNSEKLVKIFLIVKGLFLKEKQLKKKTIRLKVIFRDGEKKKTFRSLILNLTTRCVTWT